MVATTTRNWPAYGQRFDDPRARGVAQSTVMIGDAAFQQPGEVLARDQFLPALS